MCTKDQISLFIVKKPSFTYLIHCLKITLLYIKFLSLFNTPLTTGIFWNQIRKSNNVLSIYWSKHWEQLLVNHSFEITWHKLLSFTHSTPHFRYKFLYYHHINNYYCVSKLTNIVLHFIAPERWQLHCEWTAIL